MPEGKESIDIPFDYQNDFILLKVEFNNSFTLKFIFDTGAQHTLLTKREITDLLAIPYGRTFTIVGADMQTELMAHLVKDISLKIGAARANQEDILVLDEDYFQFEEFTGQEVHGIIGANLFRRFVVKINYQKEVISLYNPSYFSPSNIKKYEAVDIEVVKNKPHLVTDIQLNPADSIRCKLLIDTGASLALLLNTSVDERLGLPANAIKSNIGAGLGGFIEGYIGRVQSIAIGSADLENVTTNFQEDEVFIKSDSLSIFRNGIIGNQILSRYTLYIDYPSNKLYLKPNRTFKRKFVFDKSGLTLITTGQYNDMLIVQNVLPNSPAAEAGIYKGDIVKAINGLPVAFFSLRHAQRVLRSKSGKKIRMGLERRGFPIVRKFFLRDLI